jgi:hypothetical protein
MCYTFWCIAIVSDFPETFTEDGIVIAEGISDEQEIHIDDLNYMILCRTKAYSEQEAHDSIRKTLTEIGIQHIIDILTVTSEQKRMIRPERLIMKDLHVNGISIKKYFLGFKKENNCAKDKAYTIIKHAITKSFWHFWK